MRKQWLALVGVLMFTLPAGAGAQANAADLRIGYIDSQTILSEAPGAAQAQAEYDRQMQNFSQELDALGQEYEQLIADYEAQQSTLLPTVRQAREDEIRQVEVRYQQRLQEMEQQAMESRQRLLEPILNEMSQVIETIRAEENFSMIFDVAGQSIIAADPALDLTDEVLTRLQASAGATGNPAP